MLKNYLKIVFRHLLKSKTYSFINITGLSAGLAVSILLLLWVNDELSYDRFNEHAASLYRLSPTFDNGGVTTVWDNTPAPIGLYARKEIPEVEAACRFNEKWDITYFLYKGRKIIQWNNRQVDPAFFTMFSYPLIEGDPQHPFKDAQSIVISESAAKRIFGNEDPMDKVLAGGRQGVVYGDGRDEGYAGEFEHQV
jgi:putative ABC transport system permease protein